MVAQSGFKLPPPAGRGGCGESVTVTARQVPSCHVPRPGANYGVLVKKRMPEKLFQAKKDTI